MTRGALVFGLALVGGAAGWLLLVHPLEEEAAALAAEIAATDVTGTRERARAWPGPDAAEARRLEEALAALAPAAATLPAPPGLKSKQPDILVGNVPWEHVQALLAWAAAQPEGVVSIEVSASPQAPESASCRVMLGERAR